MRVMLSTMAALALLSCTSQKKNLDDYRGPASGEQKCIAFNKLPASQKQEALMEEHLKSATAVYPGKTVEDLRTTLLAGAGASEYTAEFIGDFSDRIKHGTQALEATGKFLSPLNVGALGFKSLKPALNRACDFAEKPHVKMVHALGTLAMAHFTHYPRLKKLDAQGNPVEEIVNPYTGLLATQPTPLPLIVRFSIANPVGVKAPYHDDLTLEFIPALGIKFLIDNQKSVDVLAMESLAGQPGDQNFFKYELSPDFSAHAPEEFNTAVEPERSNILARYKLNAANNRVMGHVGKQFFKVIPEIYGGGLDNLNKNSNRSLHPFVISIQEMAEFNRDGSVVPEDRRHRPWRLVFIPAVTSSQDAIKKITDSTEYKAGKNAADFRMKLANLRTGDRVYIMVAETEKGQRYAMGEVILDSTPIPSTFADKDFLIQHKLEHHRVQGSYVINP